MNEYFAKKEMFRVGILLLLWAVVLHFAFVVHAGTGGEISATSSDRFSYTFTKAWRMSPEIDTIFSWERACFDELETKNKIYSKIDLWVGRTFMPNWDIRWLDMTLDQTYIEVQYEIDLATDIDKATVYLGYEAKVYDSLSIDIYCGAYELDRWSFSAGVGYDYEYDMLFLIKLIPLVGEVLYETVSILGYKILFNSESSVDIPFSNTQKPETNSDNGVGINFGKYLSLGYTYILQIRNQETEQTSRISLRYEM